MIDAAAHSFGSVMGIAGAALLLYLIVGAVIWLLDHFYG